MTATKAVKKIVKKPRISKKPDAEAKVKTEKTETAKVFKAAHDKSFYAVGRRKTAVAQALVSGGSGVITVNELPLERYFMSEDLRNIVLQPLVTVGGEKNINVRSKIHGGGIHAQAESLRHAIARGLIQLNSESRRMLKKQGFLTRDPRVKERKKPGLKRARRAPQFSKR